MSKRNPWSYNSALVNWGPRNLQCNNPFWRCLHNANDMFVISTRLQRKPETWYSDFHFENAVKRAASSQPDNLYWCLHLHHLCWWWNNQRGNISYSLSYKLRLWPARSETCKLHLYNKRSGNCQKYQIGSQRTVSSPVQSWVLHDPLCFKLKSEISTGNQFDDNDTPPAKTRRGHFACPISIWLTTQWEPA